MTTDSAERGAVSVLLVGVLGVVVVLAGAVGEAGALVAARHRAGAAADLAALAAVDGDCARAARTAAENGGRLSACRRLADGSVVVEVGVTPHGPVGHLAGAVQVEARAARAP